MYRVEDYPQIRGNYFLTARASGPSKKLLGRVAVISCLMRTTAGDFSAKSTDQYYAALNQAIQWLQQQARRYCVPLEISGYHYEVDVSPNADPLKGYDLLKGFLHLPSVDAAQKHFEQTLAVNEAPLVMVFDRNGRSFAVNQMGEPYKVNELSTIFKYRDKFLYTTIIHELLHQFGGVDLYYPPAVKERAEYYFADSVMGVGSFEMDDLTAYLIGWKDTISANTYHFLKDTMWLNKQSYDQAVKDAWKV